MKALIEEEDIQNQRSHTEPEEAHVSTPEEDIDHGYRYFPELRTSQKIRICKFELDLISIEAEEQQDLL